MSDAWTENKINTCPFPDGTKLEVKLSSGDIAILTAGTFLWNNAITAYRSLGFMQATYKSEVGLDAYKNKYRYMQLYIDGIKFDPEKEIDHQYQVPFICEQLNKKFGEQNG